MVDQSISSLVTGLSNGINQYLGTKISNDMALQRQEQLAQFKQGQEGTIDSDTAESLSPGMGDVVNSFNDNNSRWPTVSEFSTLHSATPSAIKGLNSNNVSTDTLLTLLSNNGMSDDDVSALRDKLNNQGVKSLPVGIAEKFMANTSKGVLPDSSLMALAKDDPTFQGITDPNAKADYFNNLKSAFKGNGKANIQSQQELDQVSQAAMTTYQTAVTNPGKYGSDPMMATAKILGSKYNQNSVHRILLNLAAIKMHNQPQSANTPSTGSTIMGAMKNMFGMGQSNTPNPAPRLVNPTEPQQ